MVEQVTDHKLYHVTVAKPYKTPFVADQVERIGETYNPYFQFYEGAREYPITHNGAIVNVKAVSWLRQVRDKIINTSPEILARIATEVSMHYVMLARELIMEEIRMTEFSDAPSRQRCLYACATLDEARYWNQRIGENGTICELKCSGTIHQADARLLLGDSEPLSVTRARARAYWRGEVGENPEMETLFVGDVKVTGFPRGTEFD
jgi:Protein of unknown function (DUF2441)